MRLKIHNYILWQNIWGTFQHFHEMQPFTETELMLQLWSALLVRGWFTPVCSPAVCPANPPDRTAFISSLQEDDFYRIPSSAARTHSRAQVFLSVKGVQRGCCWLRRWADSSGESRKKWRGAGGVGSFHLLHVGVQFVDLWLEERFEFGPLGLQGRSQQAVLDGELLWVEVNVFHLHQDRRGKRTDG